VGAVRYDALRPRRCSSAVKAPRASGTPRACAADDRMEFGLDPFADEIGHERRIAPEHLAHLLRVDPRAREAINLIARRVGLRRAHTRSSCLTRLCSIPWLSRTAGWRECTRSEASSVSNSASSSCGCSKAAPPPSPSLRSALPDFESALLSGVHIHLAVAHLHKWLPYRWKNYFPSQQLCEALVTQL